MRGLTKIKEWTNTVLPWAKKDNELIKKANKPWFVKMPWAAGAGWGEYVFTESDKEIDFDATRASTIQFTIGGFTYTALGLKGPAETEGGLSPYIMGTNNTAPTDQPQNDNWDIETPPEVLGEPTAGVIIPASIRCAFGTLTSQALMASPGPGAVTLSLQQVLIFTRPLTFNSNGALIHIGFEEQIDNALCPTVSSF